MKKKTSRPAKRPIKRPTKRAATKRAASKSAPKKAARSSAPKHIPTQGLYSWITHTEFASADPAATKTWCAKVLGWTFKPSFPTPAGEYHMFAYSDKGGGGIHQHGPTELLGSVPFVHVADCQTAFNKALAEGAEPISRPERVMDSVTIAVVRVPGGVQVGFSGP